MNKIHQRIKPPIRQPDWYIEDKKTTGGNEAACGYLRKNTSWEVGEVTCKLCLSIIGGS